MVPIKQISITVVSSAMLSIDGNLRDGLIYEGDNIIGLDMSKVDSERKGILKAGSIVRAGRASLPYKIGKLIYVENSLKALIVPPNDSTTFITPILFSKSTYLKWKTHFVSTFLKEVDGEYYIQLLYRFSGSPKFTEFERFLIGNKDYVSTEDVDKYHILYTFKVPEEFRLDFYRVIEGKYSKTSLLYKERVLDFHSFKEEGEMGQIFSRDPKLREKREEQYNLKEGSLSPMDELYGKFNMYNETYQECYKLDLDVLEDPSR